MVLWSVCIRTDYKKPWKNHSLGIYPVNLTKTNQKTIPRTCRIYFQQMDSVYTTTLTAEALRRGITVTVIEPTTPVFLLTLGQTSIRCYNGLTDRVGAVTFLLANDKFLCNRFLRSHCISVPDQQKLNDFGSAAAFLKKHRSIVVKPVMEWGGRGVSVGITDQRELRAAITRAKKFSSEIILEQCVSGIDIRCIMVNGKVCAAIKRTPAQVLGNGRDTIRTLIKKQNRLATAIDPSNRIPVDAETGRSLNFFGLTWESVPKKNAAVTVRRTSNYHTGGSVSDITDSISCQLIQQSETIAKLFGATLLGVDFLVNEKSGAYHVLECSPDCAISPPEGFRVAHSLLNHLFPATTKPL